MLLGLIQFLILSLAYKCTLLNLLLVTSGFVFHSISVIFFFIDERSICKLDVSSFSPQYNIVMLQMFLDQFIKSAHFVDQLNG